MVPPKYINTRINPEYVTYLERQVNKTINLVAKWTEKTPPVIDPYELLSIEDLRRLVG